MVASMPLGDQVGELRAWAAGPVLAMYDVNDWLRSRARERPHPTSVGSHQGKRPPGASTERGQQRLQNEVVLTSTGSRPP
jgi:hypothetical protein